MYPLTPEQIEVLDSTADTATHVYGSPLTPREIEVLWLKIERGCTSHDAAQEIGISTATVKNMVSTMLHKTGHPTFLSLAVAAVRVVERKVIETEVEELAVQIAQLEHRVAMLETGSVSVLSAPVDAT